TFAEIAIARGVASRICITDYCHHPTFAILGLSPLGGFVNCRFAFWTERRAAGGEEDSDRANRIVIIKPVDPVVRIVGGFLRLLCRIRCCLGVSSRGHTHRLSFLKLSRLPLLLFLLRF